MKVFSKFALLVVFSGVLALAVLSVDQVTEKYHKEVLVLQEQIKVESDINEALYQENKILANASLIS